MDTDPGACKLLTADPLVIPSTTPIESGKDTDVPLRVSTGFVTPDKSSNETILMCILAFLATTAEHFKAATGHLRMLFGIGTGQVFVTLLLLLSMLNFLLDRKTPDFLQRLDIQQPAASGLCSYQVECTENFNML